MTDALLEPDPAPNYIPTSLSSQSMPSTTAVVDHLRDLVEVGEPLRPTIRMCLTAPDSPEVYTRFQEKENVSTLSVEDFQSHNGIFDPGIFDPGGALLCDADSAPQPPVHPDAIRYELVDVDRHKYKLKSTTRVMRKAMSKELPPTVEFRLHLDGGANMSVTCDQELLINYRNIKKHAIAGIAQGDAAIYATGLGYLPWRSDTGETLLIKCFYSA
mmetsp:Transcript_1224/g.1878  ORF Transcript_1224/g.1878 Transcript_1224/m.1878 type:complete len:215 (-) Transcript_1224:4473-5117(-)